MALFSSYFYAENSSRLNVGSACQFHQISKLVKLNYYDILEHDFDKNWFQSYDFSQIEKYCRVRFNVTKQMLIDSSGAEILLEKLESNVIWIRRKKIHGENFFSFGLNSIFLGHNPDGEDLGFSRENVWVEK